MKNSLFFWATRSMFLFLFLIIAPAVNAEEALQNNKALKAAKHNVDIAKARLMQAGQYPNPRLNLLNSDDSLLTNKGEYARSVGISQEFPVAGRIGN